MRASVKAAWPAVCKEFEGRLDCMYLDTKGLVTTGTGNLIDSVAAAQALPWLTKDGKPATNAQVAAEWKQIKARQSSKSLGGYAFVKWATLHIDDATIDRLLFEVTDKFWARLSQALPKIESFPADAQLVLLDEAWQNGPAFLDAGTAWKGTRAAVLAQDWKAAASHVPGTGRRADRRKRLFNNAAAVVTLGIDPDVLWDQKVPIKPTPPVVPPVPPVVPPDPEEIPDVALSDADLDKIADRVLSRDGLIPNAFTNNKTNEFVALSTAVAAIGKQLDEISATLAALKNQT